MLPQTAGGFKYNFLPGFAPSPRYAFWTTHGTVLHEDKVAVMYGNHVAFALPHTADAGHDERAVFRLVIQVGHRAIHDQMDTLSFAPRLQG